MGVERGAEDNMRYTSRLSILQGVPEVILDTQCRGENGAILDNGTGTTHLSAHVFRRFPFLGRARRWRSGRSRPSRFVVGVWEELSIV